MARQVLFLRLGTAPLPRSVALFCAGTLSTSSAPAPCSSTTGCVCLQLQTSSLPCLLSVLCQCLALSLYHLHPCRL